MRLRSHFCPQCGMLMRPNKDMLICPNCGYQEKITINHGYLIRKSYQKGVRKEKPTKMPRPDKEVRLNYDEPLLKDRINEIQRKIKEAINVQAVLRRSGNILKPYVYVYKSFINIKGIPSIEGLERKLKELIGMETVMEFEKSMGRIPEDVSGCRRYGYDIKSVDKDKECRCIEVKTITKDRFILTENEYYQAIKLSYSEPKEIRKKYWVYILDLCCIDINDYMGLYIIPGKLISGLCSEGEDGRYTCDLTLITSYKDEDVEKWRIYPSEALRRLFSMLNKVKQIRGKI